ncbi:MAG: DUF885 domain-containing protein [Planctomycetaceae bacterium]|nr:DUF885 domain-containing protein [Planctomycetaceae bacterium]
MGRWAIAMGMCLGACCLACQCVHAVTPESLVDPARYLVDDVDPARHALAAEVARFDEDWGLLSRQTFEAPAAAGIAARQAMLAAWRERLQAVDFAALALDDQIDYLLLAGHLDFTAKQLAREQQRLEQLASVAPFAETVEQFVADRAANRSVDARAAATQLDKLAAAIDAAAAKWKADEIAVPAELAPEAVRRVRHLSRQFAAWRRFYDQYDPAFTWWTKAPAARVEQALDDYVKLVREKLIGDDDDRLVGMPIGREALLDSLQHEMIPYTPEELCQIAEQELAWCRVEYKQAANEMGLGDDWRAALERVSTLHEEPGGQPALIAELAQEAIDFLDARDLVTIPPLCRDGWRMTMMSPERQRVNPYFTGGEVISVSFPTADMVHADKLMSLRGNNRHFARATVHHELIPGHHLQIFMADRYRPHRKLFRTPFLVEGWALYWEMLLWDEGFAGSPEDRVGMLFWRSHRCARILFSLQYHLGEMSAEEAVDFLVEQIGHEPRNARAEVRRSIEGSYDPLYQAAYMLGGLQLRELSRELIGTGQMTPREFHDAVLRENSIPVAMIRASLTDEPLTRDYQCDWRFYELAAESETPRED